MRRFLWIVGKFIDSFGNLLGRFRSQYLLHSFGNKGTDVHIEKGCTITSRNVYCGNHVYIGENNLLLTAGAKIIIGNNVMFAPNVSIVTGNHRTDIVGKYMTDIGGERNGRLMTAMLLLKMMFGLVWALSF